MFYDDWGNEYKTKEDAINGIHEICRSYDDYWEMIGEELCIDNDIMCWITENHLDSFKTHFAKQIKKAEDNWCEYYIDCLVEEEDKKKIKFTISADEDIVELDDNVTEEEIVNELMGWVKRCVRYSWEIIEED